MLAHAFAALSVAACASAGVTLERRSAQTSAVCLSGYSWTDNSKDNSPCLLAAVVLASCAGSDWTVPAIDANSHYTTPNSTTANLCSCSWAAYNLLSACTLCQGFQQSIQNWPFYITQCGNNLSNTYFPTQLAVPDGTLLPWYAATDPATWTGQRFNLQDAQAIAVKGHDDVTLGATKTTPKKEPAPIGAIVGSVIGGVSGVLVLILGFAWLISRRGLVFNRATTVIADKGPGRSGHMKSMSDTSQMMTANGFGYHEIDASFGTMTPATRHTRPLTMYTHSESITSHSHFGSVAHSGTIYSSPSPPPGRLMSATPINTQNMNRENIIVPFMVTSDSTRRQSPTTANSGDRKRADGAIIHVYDPPNSLPASIAQAVEGSNSSADPPSRPRINPPAYSPFPAADGTSSPTSPARSSAVHSKKRSRDTLDSNRSSSPTTPVRSTRGLSVLADVIEEMGFRRTETMMSGTAADTLATGLSVQVPRNQVFRPVVGNPDPSPISPANTT